MASRAALFQKNEYLSRCRELSRDSEAIRVHPGHFRGHLRFSFQSGFWFPVAPPFTNFQNSRRVKKRTPDPPLGDPAFSVCGCEKRLRFLLAVQHQHHVLLGLSESAFALLISHPAITVGIEA